MDELADKLLELLECVRDRSTNDVKEVGVRVPLRLVFVGLILFRMVTLELDHRPEKVLVVGLALVWVERIELGDES